MIDASGCTVPTITHLVNGRERLAGVCPLLPVGEEHAGRLPAHGLDVPGDEAAVRAARHELLALVVPAEARQLLRPGVHLLLLPRALQRYLQ